MAVGDQRASPTSDATLPTDSWRDSPGALLIAVILTAAAGRESEYKQDPARLATRRVVGVRPAYVARCADSA